MFANQSTACQKTHVLT